MLDRRAARARTAQSCSKQRALQHVPPLPYAPAAQGMQTGAFAPEDVPAAQARQTEAFAPEYVPAAQMAQTEAFPPEYAPAGQARQTDALAPEYAPAAQFKHALLPSLEYVPASQSWQSVAPNRAESAAGRRMRIWLKQPATWYSSTTVLAAFLNNFLLPHEIIPHLDELVA